MKLVFLLFFLVFSFITYSFSMPYIGVVKKSSVLPFAILRNGPSENYIRLSRLPIGTYLYIVSKHGNWLKVKLKDNFFGWIKRESVNLFDYNAKSLEFDLYNIKVDRYKNLDRVIIYLTSKPPFIIQEDDDEVLIRFFYTLDKIFELRQAINLSNIEGFTLQQVDSQELLLKIKLKKNLGYKVFYKDNKLHLLFKAKLFNSIILDPGHGGKDTGAIGKFGLKEKDINLKVALLLKDKLQKYGFKVFLTRNKDEEVYKGDKRSILKELYSRVLFAQNNEASIFISIHFNSLPNLKQARKARGSFVYYYRDMSYPLAFYIAKSFNKNLNNNFDKVGVIYRSFHVIRQTYQPSVLVECEFISNPDVEKMLSNKSYVNKITESIYKGIIGYFSYMKREGFFEF